MARLRKRKLYWAASDAGEIVGYRIYWASGSAVDYDSRHFDVGKVSETVVPEQVDLTHGPVMFGITALDKEGNESDMTTLAEPFHLQAPSPPRNLSLQPTGDYIVSQSSPKESIEPEVIRSLVARMNDEDRSNIDDPYLPENDDDEEGAPARFDIGSIF
jgi:hypothetical protein